MHKLLRLILIILSLLAGGLFLYSAYAKLFPVQPFEYTLVEYLHVPWRIAPAAARLLIGLEAGIGTLIILHLFGNRKWVLGEAFILTIIFSVYLIWLWVVAGDNVNCGCLGDTFWMSPSASLIKNSILLVVIAILLRFHNGFRFRGVSTAQVIILLIAFALPFILYPLPSGKPTWLRNDRYKLDLSEIYNVVQKDSTSHGFPDPSVGKDADLGHGKHIIAFVSPHCGHCKIAARKLHLIKQRNPNLPVFMVIGGTKSDLTDFWKSTSAQNIPHMRLDGDAFMQYTGGIFPLIVWVNDSWVDAKADYNTLNQEDIERWIKQ
jgi:hypothetical protein